MYSQLEGGWDPSVGTATTVLCKSKIREAISRMSADEEIKVGDIVKFLYSTTPTIYRLGVVRGIELGPPVYNTPGPVNITYKIELLGQRIVQMYTPTGKIKELYKHRWDIKKYHTPHLISEQVIRGSVPIDPAKHGAGSMPAEITNKILAMAGFSQNGNLYRSYTRGNANVMPRTSAAGGGSTSAAAGGSKSRRTRRNKRLSRRSTRR